MSRFFFFEKGGRERNVDARLRLSPVRAPTENQTRNPGMCLYWESNPQPFGFWTKLQPSEPHWSGQEELLERGWGWCTVCGEWVCLGQPQDPVCSQECLGLPKLVLTGLCWAGWQWGRLNVQWMVPVGTSKQGSRDFSCLMVLSRCPSWGPIMGGSLPAPFRNAVLSWGPAVRQEHLVFVLLGHRVSAGVWLITLLYSCPYSLFFTPLKIRA